MKKNRKLYAVIIRGGYEAFQSYALRGIISQAYCMDCDIAVFSILSELDYFTAYQLGEDNIANLINFDLIDGVIFSNGTFTDNKPRYDIEKLLHQKYRGPVVCLEEESQYFSSIFAENIKPFETLVDHLIDCHGLTKIYCLSGYEGNHQAEERIEGYKKSLQKHGIPVHEDYIFYGDYWKPSGISLGKKIASGELERPEAVVCANDWMAISLCNTLTDNGIRVPEDIAIAGFDGVFEAIDNIPSITTYSMTSFDVGIKAMCEIYNRSTGEHCEACTHDYGKLELGQSCGCEENHLRLMQKRKEYLNIALHYRELYKASNMSANLFSSQSLDDFLEQLKRYTFLLKDQAKYGLCLCDNWDDTENDSNDSDYLKTGYSATMRLFSEGCAGAPFHSADMIPPAFYENREYPTTFFLTPVHFNDRCFGYSVLNYGRVITVFDEVYHDWSMNINNGLEIVRVQNYFKRFSQTIYLNSIRDALTGIYNRKGFDRYSAELFDRALEDNMPLLVLAADLDGLKHINDTYGHLEGDNAITVVANALHNSCQNNEICARTGGDEFLVVGCAKYNEETISKYHSNVYRFIERYNETSGKPYSVSVSLGHVCACVTDGSRLQDLIDHADKNMYGNKAQRKQLLGGLPRA